MKRLMVVDDEAVITTQLEDRLQSMEYDVVGTASSAEESVSMARELCPDLILMDIVMKGKLDGIDAARTIKADMDIPIIFLTAYAEDKYVERAMEVEPFGYIVKPFRENEIRANIEIALHKKELERNRKQAEERIRRLFLAIEYNPYKIMIIDTGGNIEFVNNKFCQITNYTPKEVLGKHIRFLKSDEMSYGVDEDMWGKITYGEEWRGELCIRKKDGTLDLKYTVALPVKNIKGDMVLFVVVMEETAKRKKRKDILLQSEKLNSIRTMTAGIAHEFNNLFAVISGNVQLLRDSFEDHGELKEGLHTIKKTIDNGAEIIRNMHSFAKTDRDTSEYVFCDLRHLIIQAIDFTMPRWKHTAITNDINYHIDREGMKGRLETLCDPTELKEVFIYIIDNALDAMPDGGTITVATRCVRSEELGVESKKENASLPVRQAGELRTQNSELKGDFVEIIFADTGNGMSEEVKGSIFEPFFTTRRPQRIGLGMSVAHGIIRRHDGKIDVESDVGKGTTVTISIPIARGIAK